MRVQARRTPCEAWARPPSPTPLASAVSTDTLHWAMGTLGGMHPMEPLPPGEGSLGGKHLQGAVTSPEQDGSVAEGRGSAVHCRGHFYFCNTGKAEGSRLQASNRCGF